MHSKKIYLIRHGETDFNKTGIIQGTGVDSSLNDYGRKQAEMFFHKYKETPFEKVYTSALKRTIQTVRRFIDLGIPHEIIEELNEISWGRLEGIPFDEETNRRYAEILDSWKQGHISNRIEGGESPVQVKRRMEKALEKILKGKEKLVLVCMHGRAMKIMLSWIMGYELKDMDLFEHNNLSLYLLNHTDHSFVIEKANDRTHLE